MNCWTRLHPNLRQNPPKLFCPQSRFRQARSICLGQASAAQTGMELKSLRTAKIFMTQRVSRQKSQLPGAINFYLANTFSSGYRPSTSTAGSQQHPMSPTQQLWERRRRQLQMPRKNKVMRIYIVDV